VLRRSPSAFALGDPAGEAWAQVGLRAPVLAPLTIIVSLPFVLGIVDALILFFSVAWLSFVGLAIPVAMIERAPRERPGSARSASHSRARPTLPGWSSCTCLA
jgi:hypothetical protein